jgi:phosphoadenosine phosphosulfate reductase
MINVSAEPHTHAPVISEIDRFNAIGEGFRGARPEEVIRWAFGEFADGLLIATGFGAEGMALIDMAVKIIPDPNIFFLDTGFLFPQTYDLRRRLEDRYKVVLKKFQTGLTPEAQEQKYGARLWAVNPDLCCRLRKIEPLREALRGRSAWVTAIRRDQSLTRANSREVEWDYRWHLVKVNPLAGWTSDEVWDYIRRNDVPYNPLHEAGYKSIGCTHCTRPIAEGEDERAGRWPGTAKTECGLHGGPPQVRLPLPDED